ARQSRASYTSTGHLCCVTKRARRLGSHLSVCRLCLAMVRTNGHGLLGNFHFKYDAVFDAYLYRQSIKRAVGHGASHWLSDCVFWSTWHRLVARSNEQLGFAVIYYAGIDDYQRGVCLAG